MNRSLTLLALFLGLTFSYGPATGQTIQDTLSQINQRISKLDSMRLRDSVTFVKLLAANDSAAAKTTCVECDPNRQWQRHEVALVVLPFVAGLIAILIIAFAVRSFRLTEALQENEIPLLTIINPQYTRENLEKFAANTQTTDIIPPTLQVSEGYIKQEQPDKIPAKEYRPSISRLIALLSGVLTCIVALSAASFFIYYYICTGCAPSLSGLGSVLIALGLGIAPYVTNKITAKLGNRNHSTDQ